MSQIFIVVFIELSEGSPSLIIEILTFKFKKKKSHHRQQSQDSLVHPDIFFVHHSLKMI
jgi:hypothetical protein